MAWRWTDIKPLSDPMLTWFMSKIILTRFFIPVPLNWNSNQVLHQLRSKLLIGGYSFKIMRCLISINFDPGSILTYFRCISIYWNGKVVRLTALDITREVENKLQRPQWWPGQSPWQPFHFCDMQMKPCIPLQVRLYPWLAMAIIQGFPPKNTRQGPISSTIFPL